MGETLNIFSKYLEQYPVLTYSIFCFIILIIIFFVLKKITKKAEKIATNEKVRIKPKIEKLENLPESCKEFCNDVQLDKYQRQALTSPFKQILVIAGAGAGKTKVLTKRVILLSKYLEIPIEQILVLAFNNTAAQEVAERVCQQLDLSFEMLFKKNIRTIHSLAYEIFRLEMPNIKILSEERDIKNILKQILNKEKESKHRQKYIEGVIGYFGHGNKNIIRFTNEKIKEFSEEIECSDRTRVKSKAERDIVESLIKNKIKYKYEPLVTWADMYIKPDFYLPEYDIYVEYWGMIDHYDPILKERYIRHMEWKKQQFRQYRFYLINLEPPSKHRSQKPEEYLIKHLKTKCRVKSTPGPNQRKLDKIFNILEDQLIETIISVLNITIAYSQKIEAIIPKADPLIRAILEFILPYCEKFEKQLELKGRATFTQIMKGAVDVLRNNPAILARYRNSYKFIFVDEVQDLQPLTREFIKMLVGEDQALFAIGDDYQSIYSFAGSDPAFIVKFEHYFPDVEKIKLLYNYRCHPKIVDISNVVIRNNSMQDFKEVIGKYKEEQSDEEKVVTVLLLEDEEKQRSAVIDYVKQQIPEKESLNILARYGKENSLVKPYIDLLSDKINKKEYEFLTIHRSKGLEADNILILGCIDHVNEKYCFPAADQAQSITDKVLRICRGPDFNLLEEETRLFYVAVTRAKKRVFIVTVKGKESRFVRESYLPREKISFKEFNLV